MKKITTLLSCICMMFVALQIQAQTNEYKLEDQYMKCMCDLFPDKGTEFKTLIKNAEQKLISAEVLTGTDGKNYISLFNNIRMAIDGRVANFGISDYVIKSLMASENAKKYNACMMKMMQETDFKDSKLSKFITLSTTSGSNPKITDLTSKMLKIFEAKDFNHDFYKYLTFSLIDKYNMANKKE